MRAWRLVRAKRFQKLLLLTHVYTHNPRLLHEKYQTVTFCNIQRKLLSCETLFCKHTRCLLHRCISATASNCKFATYVNLRCRLCIRKITFPSHLILKYHNPTQSRNHSPLSFGVESNNFCNFKTNSV